MPEQADVRLIEVFFMQKRPLVSVCIPVYNNEKTLEETMRSVLSQTYSDLELIVVDDNSRDGSLSLMKEAAGRAVSDGLASQVFDLSDRQVSYKNPDCNPATEAPEVDFSDLPEAACGHTIWIHHNDENLGMAGNWNKCLSLCRGDYMKLICADDLLAPSLIETEEGYMEEYPDVLLVQSDTQFLDMDGKPQGFYKRYKKSGVVEGKEAVRHSFFTRDYLGAPLANLIRSSAYKEYGGIDPAFSYIVDYDFFVKLAVHGKLYIIHEPLNFFRLRSDSNTGEVLGGDQGEAYVAEHRKLVEKYQDVLGLTDTQVNRSVRIRKLMNLLGGVYLKLHLG